MSDPVYLPVEAPHEPIHVLVCADAFAGKSVFAATFPKPLLVTSFDPFGKEHAYLKLGRAGGLYTEANGMVSRLIYHPTEDVVVAKVEHYLDADPESPTAWIKFRERMRKLPSEATRWGTWVIDSITFAEFSARLESMYVVNKGGHGKQHYGHSKEQVEVNLLARVAWMPINVVAIGHYDDDKDEVNNITIKNPSVPGKLTKRMPAGFGEMYRLVVDHAKKTRSIQSVPDNVYNAGSLIGVPNGCPATYAGLWTGVAS